MPDKDLSLFSTVASHDEKLEVHGEILEKHAHELKVQAEQIKQLQDNAIKLENVVMSENRDTRRTITETNSQLRELINDIMGYKTTQTQMSTNLRMAQIESIAKIIGILAGSGGILFYLFGN